MLISIKNRFIFLSNTKTASTSLEAALLNYCEIQRDGTPERKHISWRGVLEEYDFLFGIPQYSIESFFRFGIIREPLDWFVSWYNYRLNNKVESPLKPGISLEEFWRMDDWVKWEAKGKKRLQKSLFVDNDGVCRFNAVIPLSELNRYAPLVLKRIGVKEEIPTLNKSGKSIAVRDVNPSLAEEVKEFWCEDYLFYEEMKEKCERELMSLKFNIVYFDNITLVSKVYVDKMPLCLNKDQPLEINGVVVLSANAADGYSLVVVDKRGEHPVQWGIESPVMAKTYPENPNAGKARFKAANMWLSEDSPLSLFLVDNKGGRYKIIDAWVVA
jgi:hypothetical protein